MNRNTFPIVVKVDGCTTITMYENGTARMDTNSSVKRFSSVQYLTWKWLPQNQAMFVTGDLRWGLEDGVPAKMREAYKEAITASLANILEAEG